MRCKKNDEQAQRDPHEFTLTFRSEPGWTLPPLARLRKLLKLALRVCGLRCSTIDQPQEKGEEK